MGAGRTQLVWRVWIVNRCGDRYWPCGGVAIVLRPSQSQTFNANRMSIITKAIALDSCVQSRRTERLSFDRSSSGKIPITFFLARQNVAKQVSAANRQACHPLQHVETYYRITIKHKIAQSHANQFSNVQFNNRACKLFNIRLYATLCFNYFRWYRRMFLYGSVFKLLIC